MVQLGQIFSPYLDKKQERFLGADNNEKITEKTICCVLLDKGSTICVAFGCKYVLFP